MGAAFLAATGSVLLAAVPYIVASAVIAHLPLARLARMVPFLGCGCGNGPSALSLPGATATAFVFGLPAAMARFGAAFAVSRLCPRNTACEDRAVLAPLRGLLLPSLGAAWLHVAGAAVLAGHRAPALAAAAGTVFAFLAAPCALATPALAASLRACSPHAAFAFLCVAGIADARVFGRRMHPHGAHADAFAYVLLAAASAIAALRGGAQLVTPQAAAVLWLCVPVCLAFALAHRTQRAPSLRIAPAVALAATFAAAPPPPYHATETTLADAFAGERVTFTGTMTRTQGVTTLVRYAITCCRADAAPVVLRLERASGLTGWARAQGTLVQTGAGLALRVDRLTAVPVPADPFVYR